MAKIQRRELDLEKFSVEAVQCIQGYFLRGGAAMPLGREMSQKGLYLRGAHFARMSAAMIADISNHPMNIGSFSLITIMIGAQPGAELIQ